MRRPSENIRALAKAKGVKPEDITALILERPRHADLVAAVRKAGAAVRFITDGDVAGVIHTTEPDETGIDIYLGIGGAPEGVLAAAALACIGGQMQGRLVLDTEEKRERARKMGIKDPRKKYSIKDMVQGDCVFSATGVTTGSMLQGVQFRPGVVETETVVMRSATGTVRWIKAEHRYLDKFEGEVRRASSGRGSDRICATDRLDSRRLDDGPPLVDLCLLQGAERLRRLILRRRDLQADLGQSLAQRRVGQSLPDGVVEPGNDVGRRASRRPHSVPERQVEARHAGLVDRRNVGGGGPARLPQDRKSLDRLAVQVRKRL